MSYVLHNADCLEVLPTLAAASVDVVLTDPPYPCIKRSYGIWTEAEWFAMMRVVVPECMRVLKPSGSAVFILQPNSERVGRMRTWLWEFMLWVGKEWGIVQDAWWWNHTAPPTVHANRTRGLMRPSIKAVVWVGLPDCYRNQDNVLWQESDANKSIVASGRCTSRLDYRPAGYSWRESRARTTAACRGGSTPFNLLPIAGRSAANGLNNKHDAATPIRFCDWWLRYLCPPGGTVLDPFSGSGTVPLAAIKQGKHAIGIERDPEYHAIAQRRLEAAQVADPLFAGLQREA